MAKNAKREDRTDAVTTDMIADWRHNNCPALSVDAILARPLDALRMGVEVGIKQQKISPRAGKRISRLLHAIVKAHPQELDAAEAVCHAAMNARKRGDLKADKH